MHTHTQMHTNAHLGSHTRGAGWGRLGGFPSLSHMHEWARAHTHTCTHTYVCVCVFAHERLSTRVGWATQECLEDHLDDPKFSGECKEELENMIARRVANFSLDTALREACEGDLEQQCQHRCGCVHVGIAGGTCACGGVGESA